MKLTTFEQSKTLTTLFKLTNKKSPKFNFMYSSLTMKCEPCKTLDYPAYCCDELGELLANWIKKDFISLENWPKPTLHGWECAQLTIGFETETEARGELIIFYLRDELNSKQGAYIETIKEVMLNNESLFNIADYNAVDVAVKIKNRSNAEDFHERFEIFFTHFHKKITCRNVWEKIGEENCAIYDKVIQDWGL
ncbi:MAG: hypothetical protein GY928_32140 [Colwellia sp.]|nr:hypothetical protein [Colwellia sp.]